MAVKIDGKIYYGVGNSKKNAKNNVAENVLQSLKNQLKNPDNGRKHQTIIMGYF